MNTNEISFHYHNSLYFDKNVFVTHPQDKTQEGLYQQLILEMMNYGYVPSEDFSKLILKTDIGYIYNLLIPMLQKSVGGDVKHKPMYPNFPKQVQEMQDIEWIINALVHYYSGGTWLPEYDVKFRESAIEPNIEFKEIGVVTKSDLEGTFIKLLSSEDSLTQFDKDALEYFLQNDFLDCVDSSRLLVPFAETRCLVLDHFIKENDLESFNKLINNITDILRVCTHISKGDVSLAKNTKFINISRSKRRFITKSLEIFWDDETAYRHKNKWVKLLHSLHVGDYSDVVWKHAQKLRENIKIETFNSNVEKCLKNGNFVESVNLLKQRPSEFARRLDHLVRLSNSQIKIIDQFFNVVEKVPTKIIIQLIGHFKHRTTERKSVVTPKGVMAKAVLVTQKGELSKPITDYILDKLNQTLFSRFYDLEAFTSEIGKVWIDSSLRECPVPSGMRSVSNGLVVLPRGTRLDFGDDSTIRMFVHWMGSRVDVDLSATFHDENFKTISNVSYTNIRNEEMKSWHSGDITSAPAPDGASEFIDIDIEIAGKNARYVALNVLSFSREKFKDIDECFVGWMGRSKPNSNEIYDAKTVKQCLNLVNENTYVCPVLFDLLERKVITVDVTKKTYDSYGGYCGYGVNNVESNMAGIEDILYSVVNPRKMSLYELFEIHVDARTAGLVDNKDEAEFTFGIEDCDINVSDWDKIQIDWMS